MNGATERHIRMTTVAYNPCVIGPLGIEPAIDVNLVFAYRQICLDGVLQPMEYRIVSGSHDAFPWHELYLNGTEIYRFDPCTHPGGPDIDALWGSSDVDMLVRQPQLAEWRIVPGQ